MRSTEQLRIYRYFLAPFVLAAYRIATACPISSIWPYVRFLWTPFYADPACVTVRTNGQAHSKPHLPELYLSPTLGSSKRVSHHQPGVTNADRVHIPVRETLPWYCVPPWERHAFALSWRQMDETSNRQLAAAAWTRETYVNLIQGDAFAPIEPTSHSPGFVARGYSDGGQSPTEPTVVVGAEGKLVSFGGEERAKSRTDDENWRNKDDRNTAQAADEQDEAIFLLDDPANMSSWTGQPSVKGSSETMRMILLTFSSVGMTYAVPARFCC